MRRLVPLLLATLWAAFPSAARGAQPVQRCVAPDGRAVYTDRHCDDVGAVDRVPPAAGSGARVFRGGCPRTLSGLVAEIGAAIRSRDVNRLASVYDWSGVGDAPAARALDRLEAMAERPLVDIAPVYPAEDPYPSAPPAADAAPPHAAGDPETAAASGGPAEWMPSWRVAAAPPDDGFPPADAPPATGQEAAARPAPPRPRPVGLRVEQTLAGSVTPARTVFGLRRNYGCFWIAF